jgi:hypothetical protein
VRLSLQREPNSWFDFARSVRIFLISFAIGLFTTQGEYTARLKVWGEAATNPAISTDNFHFPEGSMVVKAAVFVSDNPAVQQNWWSVTDGAAMVVW